MNLNIYNQFERTEVLIDARLGVARSLLHKLHETTQLNYEERMIKENLFLVVFLFLFKVDTLSAGAVKKILDESLPEKFALFCSFS